MYFRTCGLMTRMLGAGKNEKFSVMDTYDFLWTDEERKEAKKQQYKKKMEEQVAKSKDKHEQEDE